MIICRLDDEWVGRNYRKSIDFDLESYSQYSPNMILVVYCCHS